MKEPDSLTIDLHVNIGNHDNFRLVYCRAKAKDLNFNFGQNELLSYLEQWTSVLSCGQISCVNFVIFC